MLLSCQKCKNKQISMDIFIHGEDECWKLYVVCIHIHAYMPVLRRTFCFISLFPFLSLLMWKMTLVPHYKCLTWILLPWANFIL